MMKKMNKDEFINILQNKTKLSKVECIIVNDILEKNFLLGKQNREKIINELIDELNITEDKGIEIYITSKNIITSIIKEKIKHPFRTQN